MHRVVIGAFLTALLFVCQAASLSAASTSLTVASAPKLVTRQVSVQAFSSISLSSSFRVQYTVSPTSRAELTITAPSDCIDFLKAEVENGELMLYYDFGDDGALKNGQIFTQKDGASSKVVHNITGTLVQITAPAVEALNLSSAGDLEIMNSLTAPADFSALLTGAASLTLRDALTVSGSLKLSANAASDVTGKGITCQSVSIEANSAAQVEWQGSLVVKRDATLSVNSAADVKGSTFVCNTANISVQSGARCEVQRVAAQNLTGDAGSGAELLLSGSCTNAVLSGTQGGKIDTYTMQAQTVTAQATTGADVYAPSAESITYSHQMGGKVRWRAATKVHEQ